MNTPAPELSFELYQPHHYPGLKTIMQASFADIGEDACADEEELAMLSALYPRGQIVCLLNGEVIGANLARIVPFDRYAQAHTQENCINKDLFVPDTVKGDAVYGLDVFVDPRYQNLRIGKQIVELLIKNTFEDNFRCMMGICRVVNFPAVMHEMDCETYAHKVKARELNDAVLSFHFRNGMEFVNVSPNFCEDDIASAGYGVILQIPNPNFDPKLPIYPVRAHALREFEGKEELVSVA